MADLALGLLNSRRLDLANVTASLLDVSIRRLSTATSEFDDLLHRASIAVRTRVNGHLQTVTELATLVDFRSRGHSKEHFALLNRATNRLFSAAALRLERAGTEIDHINTTIRLRNPDEVLRRGFSITRVNGKAVRSVGELPPGAVMQTIMHDGSVTSTVKEGQ